jgi:hypothetical protein
VVSLFPGIHRVFTAGVAVAGLLVLGYILVKRRPKTPAALARLVGWIMTVGILLAPATRVGYLLYPVDFFVWAWLLRSEDTVDPPPDESRGLRRPVMVGAGQLDDGGGPIDHGDHDGHDEPDGSFSDRGITGGSERDSGRVLTASRPCVRSVLIRHGVEP